MKKKILSICIPIVSLVLLLFVTIISAVAGIAGAAGGGVGTGQFLGLPEEVEQYRGLVNKYCAEYGLQGYEDILLAIMAVESGGIGEDPMNASGSPFNGYAPKDITSPEYSIEIAVRTLQSYIAKAGVSDVSDFYKVLLVIQAYSFGEDYISWALGRPEQGFSTENAKEYYDMHKAGNPIYIQRISLYWQPENVPEDDTLPWANNIVVGDGTFLWPVPYTTAMSRGYGVQSNGYFHRGLDITTSGVLGKDIIAAAGGIISTAMYGHGSYGNYIVIDHGNGYKTLYAHCISLSVSVGQSVMPGEVLGYVGSTGNSTGPHLHFEVMQNGTTIDPIQFF